MKFAKELDENAVPEWKEKYLDYRKGKKKLKAVRKAIRNADRQYPAQSSGAGPSPFGSSLRDAPVRALLDRGRSYVYRASPRAAGALQRSQSDVVGSPRQAREEADQRSAEQGGLKQIDERSPLTKAKDIGSDHGRPQRTTRYGSIIGTPPDPDSPVMQRLRKQVTAPSMLELPDPALGPALSNSSPSARLEEQDEDDDSPISPRHGSPHPPLTQLAHTGNAYKVRRPVDWPTEPSPVPRHLSMFRPHRTNSAPVDSSRPPFMRRLFSVATNTPSTSLRDNNDVALEAYREVDFRKQQFVSFLGQELVKIEDFYKEKETDAEERLGRLREQLHILRDCRLEELTAVEQLKHKSANGHTGSDGEIAAQLANGNSHHGWTGSVVSQVDNALDKVRNGPIGKTSKAMRDLGTPETFRIDPGGRDYGRKKPVAISYRNAKTKLKAALVEYYRALELLKHYALQNSTAFKKITKKCDKTTGDSTGKEYMVSYVVDAHFVTSDKVDVLMQQTEDLYARYFERGNRKLAMSKLRSKGYKARDYTGSTLRAGLLTGAGFVLSLFGLIRGVRENVFDPDPVISTQASYLMQIYAGYFLLLILMAVFCVACRVFVTHKVNYRFIFELNAQTSIDWRQLSEITSILFFLQGLVMFLNFALLRRDVLWLYWPIILIGLAVVILFAPIPVLYWKTRRWFVASLGRLLLSGLYPVEFRDVFFGDLACSETYAVGNIELFFCLYATHWTNPPKCNSSNSHLFGFFQTLPGIWRGFQCLRRYRDTKDPWPHLANMVKYTCTVLSYLALSLFRIHRRHELLAIFIFFSSINSLYCSIWDVIMDFSLGDPAAKYPFLRDQLQFKWYWYYIALVLDPILRFNWIFYVIFAADLQHSSVVSFCISLSEVFRRGMWIFLRVENEQCANNRHMMASREPPLPYSYDPHDHTNTYESAAQAISTTSATTQQQPPAEGERPTPGRLETAEESPVVQTLRRVGTAMISAHAQDYQRKRVPERESLPESDDDDDDDD